MTVRGRRALVAAAAAVACTVAVAVLASSSVPAQRDVLLSGAPFVRAPPGDKGRRGGQQAKIQRETRRVIERAGAVQHQALPPSARSGGMVGRALRATKVPRTRDAVAVVKAVVDATTAAADRKEEKEEGAARKAAAARARAAATGMSSPKKWNWKEWQEQEEKDILSSSTLPTTASAAQKAATESAALKTAAVEAGAAKVSSRELQDGDRGGKDAKRDAKKALVHAAATAKKQSAQVRIVKSTGAATGLRAYQSKWNWAQWQEEAKQLLLHSHTGSPSAKQQTSSPSSKGVATTSVAASPSQSTAGDAFLGSSKTPPAITTSKEDRIKALQKRVKDLEVVQENADALSKVEKQDASIKHEIKSVMKHVSQVDKEKHALTVAISADGKHTGNTFTRAGGKIVATSLSKSTLKAMKQAQLAGWAADNAAKARAKAAAAANYAKMRDEMFRKDAEKQVKDEQQLRAEQKEAREVGEATSHDDARLLHSLDQLNKGHEPSAHLRYAACRRSRSSSYFCSCLQPALSLCDSSCTKFYHHLHPCFLFRGWPARESFLFIVTLLCGR